MELEIKTDVLEQTYVVCVGGELDIYTAPRLLTALQQAMDAENRLIVLDLSEVHFIDSTGLGVLAGAFQKARSGGCDLRFVLDDPYLLKMFRITGFDNLFAIYPTMAAALAPAA
jgi:anti-sigma B factor antagonist